MERRAASGFKILDSSLREGLQSVHPFIPDKAIMLARKEQLRIAEALRTFGVEYIEVGSPIGSPYKSETIKQIVELIGTSPYTRVLAHCRCVKDDIQAALDANVHGINLYLKGTNGYSLEQFIQMAQNAVTFIREKDNDMFVRFSTEDAFRTDRNALVQIVREMAPLVDRIGFPDTTGGAHPLEVLRLFQDMGTLVHDDLGLENVDFEFHAHDDCMMAPANYLMAAEGGATVFDTTVFGYGERNGIPDIFSFIAMMRQHHKEGLNENYQMDQLTNLAEVYSQSIGIEVPSYLSLIGGGFFKDVAGVHAIATGRDENAYRLKSLPADLVGKENAVIVRSQVVGGGAIEQYAQKKLGIQLSKKMSQHVAAIIREEATITGDVSYEYIDFVIADAMRSQQVFI